MIRYFIDHKEDHKEDLLYHLRKHNVGFLENTTEEIKYIYLYRNESLCGAIKARLHWDWVGFSNVYYEDVHVLQALVSEVVKHIEGDLIGYQTFSYVKQTVADFKQAGFEVVGTIPGPKYLGDRINLQLTDLHYSVDHNYSVNITKDELEEHKTFLEDIQNQYIKKHQLEYYPNQILYVAMDDETFCGGIEIEEYTTFLHIHLLAVNQEYRGNKIGTNLMRFAEEYAIKHNKEFIDLSTVEFQARPFYEKLGYQVTFTRDNYPKGYKCYNLYKKLKE